MRILDAGLVSRSATALCRRASTRPVAGLHEAFERAMEACPEGAARDALSLCLENLGTASELGLPLCQDTGLPVFFVELGSGVSISGGTLECALGAGTALACSEGYLRPSIVREPASSRLNTGDSTPPVIHIETCVGEEVRIRLILRGAGSENASRSAMLPPHAGEEGIISFVVDSVAASGACACPPLFVSVGIGGNLEGCAILAKKGLLRPVGSRSPDAGCASLEDRLLAAVNGLGIGPQGFGGPVTAFEARVTSAPCHMASLPVSVCMGCHSLRTAEETL